MTEYNDVPFIPSNDCSNWEGCQEEAYKRGYDDAKEIFLFSDAYSEGLADGIEDERPKAYSNGYDAGYHKGRADAIDSVWKNAISKYDEVLSLEELAECIEQLKEQKNEN